jgi:hypothetical protein
MAAKLASDGSTGDDAGSEANFIGNRGQSE